MHISIAHYLLYNKILYNGPDVKTKTKIFLSALLTSLNKVPGLADLPHAPERKSSRLLLDFLSRGCDNPRPPGSLCTPAPRGTSFRLKTTVVIGIWRFVVESLMRP